MSFFTKEIPTIKRQFLKADYPPRFADSVSKQLNEKCNGHTEDDYIIKPYFFDILKPLVLPEFPYCLRNEPFSKRFIKRFHELANNSYQIKIKWITK